MRYIAIDIGSTHIKRAVVDTGRLAISHPKHAMTPAPIPQARSRHEIDAQALLACVRPLIDEGLALAPDAAGVLFSSQMHGCVVTDGQGQAATGLITWQDGAGLEEADPGQSYVQQLSEKIGGGDPQCVRPARKLAIGNLYARIAQGLALGRGHRFHTPGGYIAYRLGGGFACHPSYAASTGCASADGSRWNRRAIEAAGLAAVQFPAIVPAAQAMGSYRYGGRDYALYPDIGDHQCGALGSLMRQQRDIQINIGTGGMAGRIVRGWSRKQGIETRPLLGDWYIDTITGLPGGRHIRVIVDFILQAAAIGGHSLDEEAVWTWATSIEVPAAPMRLDADFFSQTGGALLGIHAGDFTPQALLASAYGAVAQGCSEAAERLGGGERIVYSGGAVARNPSLRAAIERACRLPGATPPGGDGAMLGLMRLALSIQGVSLEESGEMLAAALQN